VLVCNWPHSVGQNHFVVKMLFNRDSTIQSTSIRFCTDYKSKNLIPCQPSGRHVIPSGRPAFQCISRSDDVSYRPDTHQTKSIIRPDDLDSRLDLPLCREACIRPDILVARPDDS
jgi:hypothetical protein